MMPKLSIILMESDIRAKNDIAAVLKSFDGAIGTLTAAANFQEGITLIQAGEPQIVFLEVTEVEQGVKEIGFLVSRFPQTTVIVTAPEKNSDWILRLIRAGASEYLTKPIITEELTAAIYKVSRLHERTKEQAASTGTAIAVYNPTGGMGTTTIAVNLAAALAEQGKSVVLVDLNFSSGDVTTFLDLTPRYTLATIIARRGHVDASFLKSVIITHPSGLHVLCAPLGLGEADNMQTEQLREVITVLKSIFAYTIIDCGGPLFGYNLATFESSDQILFVTLLNLPALKNAKRYLAAMSSEGLRDTKVKLIVNRLIPKDDIKVADAEKILSTKVFMTVPNAYMDVKTAINRGEPLVTSSPRSPVTKAMQDLARQVMAVK